MSESSVLIHSNSLPVPKESHQANTIQDISQSASFGRFTTEVLDWGKWSTFTHKKYVEEAEKFSRPGSVKEKTAFFEAHYKTKASTKQQPPLTPIEEQEPERISIQIDDVVVYDDTFVVNDLANELDENENLDTKKKLEEELSNEDTKERRSSVSKITSVFRLSLEKLNLTKPVDTETEIVLSERPINRRSETNEEKPVHRKRFSFLRCFLGNAKIQDQNQSRKKKKTEKKKQKQKHKFLCLCLKPKSVRE